MKRKKICFNYGKKRVQSVPSRAAQQADPANRSPPGKSFASVEFIINPVRKQTTNAAFHDDAFGQNSFRAGSALTSDWRIQT